MQRIYQLSVVIGVLFLFSACVSLNNISLSQLPKDRSMPISAQGSDWSLLGLTLSNDFVDEVIGKVRNQCRNGKIQGILTKYQTVTYFFVFKREVFVKAYCVKGA